MRVITMVRRLKQKCNESCIRFACKLQNDQSGMAAWEILLMAMVGIVLVGYLLKAVSPAVANLWDSMVSKFQSLLSV